MEEQDQTQSHSPLCRQNCGYFGHAMFDGLCSKCHKEQEARKAKEARAVPPQESPKKFSESTERSPPEPKCVNKECESKKEIPEVPENVEKPSTTAESAPKTRTHPRCKACNRRVGLTGFTCRCGDLFCTVHRYSDAHNCPFDYRSTGQADIAKANPQVISSKINKI